MKRIMAAVLALVLALGLAGCGGQEGIATPPDAGSAAQQEQQEQQPLPDWLTVGELAEPVQLVSAEEGGLNITATDIQYSPAGEDYQYLEVTLEVENTTGQNIDLYTIDDYGLQNIYDYPYNSAINGYAIPCSLWGGPEAGQTTSATAAFLIQDMRLSGITEVADIRLSLMSCNEETGETRAYPNLSIPTSLAATHDYSTDGLQAALDNGAFEDEGYTLVFDTDQDSSKPTYARRIVGFTGADGSSLVGMEFYTDPDSVGAEIYWVSQLFLNNVQMFPYGRRIALDPDQTGILFFEVTPSMDGASVVGTLARVDAILTLYAPYSNTEYLILDGTEAAGDLSILAPADVGQEVFNAGGVQLFFNGARTEEDAVYIDLLAYTTDSSLSSVRLSGEGATANGAPFVESEDVWVPTTFAWGDLLPRRYSYMLVDLDAETLAAAGVSSPSALQQITIPVIINSIQDLGTVTLQLQ